VSGLRVAIIGYGWVGRGIASYVRQLGGRAIVVEVDPIRALEAHMDGHEVAAIASALADAVVVITATGGVRAIGSRHFDLLTSGVVLANAGHHDLEIDVPALAEASSHSVVIRDGVTRYSLGDKEVNVLADGALVNVAGGLGHPIEIMDLSFSVQALSCHELVTGTYTPGVHLLPRALDEAIARAKLASLGVELDRRTDDQDDPIAEFMERR
jgi:adenosylhomocysteinase